MKRALLISDSHGQDEEMLAVVRRLAGGQFRSSATERVDAIFHMGDIGNSKRRIEQEAHCLVYVVRGNTDYDYDLPETVAIDFAGKRILATHGHRYVDFGGIDSLRYFGEENKADVVLFGHTHRPVLEEFGDLLICNPGSISRPRQRDREHTFAVLTVEDDGSVRVDFYAVYEVEPGKIEIEEYEKE